MQSAEGQGLGFWRRGQNDPKRRENTRNEEWSATKRGLRQSHCTGCPLADGFSSTQVIGGMEKRLRAGGQQTHCKASQVTLYQEVMSSEMQACLCC